MLRHRSNVRILFRLDALLDRCHGCTRRRNCARSSGGFADSSPPYVTVVSVERDACHGLPGEANRCNLVTKNAGPNGPALKTYIAPRCFSEMYRLAPRIK